MFPDFVRCQGRPEDDKHEEANYLVVGGVPCFLGWETKGYKSFNRLANFPFHFVQFFFHARVVAVSLSLVTLGHTSSSLPRLRSQARIASSRTRSRLASPHEKLHYWLANRLQTPQQGFFSVPTRSTRSQAFQPATTFATAPLKVFPGSL